VAAMQTMELEGMAGVLGPVLVAVRLSSIDSCLLVTDLIQPPLSPSFHPHYS
jgi:hypothetical protein